MEELVKEVFKNFGRQSLADRKGQTSGGYAQPLVPVLLSPSLLCYEKCAPHTTATTLLDMME